MRSMAWGLVQAGSATVSQTTDCGQSSSTHRGGGALSGRGLAMIRALWRSMLVPAPPPSRLCSWAGRSPSHLTIDFTHSAHTAQEKGVEKKEAARPVSPPAPGHASTWLRTRGAGHCEWVVGGGRCWWRGCLLLALACCCCCCCQATRPGGATRLQCRCQGFPPATRHP